MKTLIFAGSIRQAAYSRKLAQEAAHLARLQGAQVTLLELSSLDIPMYNADLEAQGTPDAVLHLKEIMDAHAAWIIVTPEYNGSYPALLKNTLDWASSPVKEHPIWSCGDKPFAGKVVGLLSASPGGMGGMRAISHLQPLLLGLGCWLAPHHYSLPFAGTAFDEKHHLKEASVQKAVARVVQQTLWAGERLKG